MPACRESLPCLRPQERVGREARNLLRKRLGAVVQGAGRAPVRRFPRVGRLDTSWAGLTSFRARLSNSFRRLKPARYAISIDTGHDGRSFRSRPANAGQAGRIRSRFGRKRFRYSHISRASPVKGISSFLKSSSGKIDGPLRSGGRPNTERPSYGSVTGARLACTAKTGTTVRQR